MQCIRKDGSCHIAQSMSVQATPNFLALGNAILVCAIVRSRTVRRYHTAKGKAIY